MAIFSPAAWLVTIAVVALSLGEAAAQGQPVHTGSSIPVYLWFIGAGILGLAIAYGMLRNRGRTLAEKQLTESTTKDVYQAEERKRRGF